MATTDQQLDWEARQRPGAAVAAALGGLLSFAGAIYNSTSLSDVPPRPYLDALQQVAKPGPVGDEPSLRITQFEFFQDHLSAFVIGAILLGLSALAAAGALTYLAFATRARAERFLRFALIAPVVGGVLTLVGSLLTALSTGPFVDGILAGERTVDAVSDAHQPAGFIAGQLIAQFGGLTLAIAFVLVSLNAMRVGLLTRVFGGLGIFIGVLVVLPVPLLSQVLQPMWLLALSALFLNRWPSGMPPAWRTGRAEPWPSAAQAREQREGTARPAGRVSDEPSSDEPSSVAAAEPAKPHPSSKKRKRKRRG